jgi:protein-tyrosine-phosphatase/tRNA A37 threonylcarbamoyladenosine synthetase subunit TsaC/SUA5/YrdC
VFPTDFDQAIDRNGIMPEVLEWRRVQPAEAIERAYEHLRAGHMVVFPTDTVYEAAAIDPDAFDHLSSPVDLTVPVLGLRELLDWVPDLSPLGQRLVRRCWPGPLKLVSTIDPGKGRVGTLPDAVRRRLNRSGFASFRSPGHEAIHMLLRKLAEPLLAHSGQSVNAAQALEEFGPGTALVIDDGPTHFGRNATEVRVDGRRWELLREGVLGSADVEELTPCHILFVCTGNTCRSPLAEALCRRLLADRLGCPPTELRRHGFVVQSAGLVAIAGGRAAAEAEAIAQEVGADLTQHQSQPLTMELLAQADFLFAMTRAHLLSLLSLDPQGVGPVPRLLSPQGEDIADPIGGDMEIYRKCASQIRRHLEELLPELQAA